MIRIARRVAAQSLSNDATKAGQVVHATRLALERSASLPSWASAVIQREYLPTAQYVLSPDSWRQLAVLSQRMHNRIAGAGSRIIEDDSACRRLAIPARMRRLVHRSVERGERPHIGRMDWALDALTLSPGPDGCLRQQPGGFVQCAATAVPRLLEYNCDTYGLLVESALLTPAALDAGLWGEGYTDGGRALSAAIQRSFASVLPTSNPQLLLVHHPGDRIIVEVAKTLEALAASSGEGRRCNRVEYPALSDAALTAYVGAVMKIFRWAAVMAEPASAFPTVQSLLELAEARSVPIMEPAIAYLMHNKGLMAYVYQQALREQEAAAGADTSAPVPDAGHLIPTALDAAGMQAVLGRQLGTNAGSATFHQGDAHAETAPAGGWIWKPFHGIKAQEIAVFDREGASPAAAGVLAAHGVDRTYATSAAGSSSATQEGIIAPQQRGEGGAASRLQLQGGAVQQFLRLRGLPQGPGRPHVVPILSTWLVDGVCVAAIVREDSHIVTRDDACAVVGVTVGDIDR
jgi:glutathionylspermidine synthase